MLTAEENDLLTRTGPGAPAGELLRRYWQPRSLERGTARWWSGQAGEPTG